MVLVIALFWYSFKLYGDSKFNEGVEIGQKNSINFVLEQVRNNGFVEIKVDDENSVFLVPSYAVDEAQTKVVTDILGSIYREGFVKIIVDNESYVLTLYDSSGE